MLSSSTSSLKSNVKDPKSMLSKVRNLRQLKKYDSKYMYLSEPRSESGEEQVIDSCVRRREVSAGPQPTSKRPLGAHEGRGYGTA